MKEIACKLLILGGGPGGYVCAIRAGQFGVDTVLVEAGRLGGVCLNVGCIPSKAMIHAADEFHEIARLADGASPLGITTSPPKLNFTKTLAWKEGIVGRLRGGVAALLKKNRVKIVEGQARFRDGKTIVVDTEIGEQIIRAEAVVIATGSAPMALPMLPFGGRIISSSEALSLAEPPARLAVVGAGYIGVELGTAYVKLGSRVTLIEATGKILPHYDEELTRPVARRLAALGVETITGAKARRLAGETLVIEHGESELRVEADMVLVTVGRRPITEGWGIEELALDMDGPFIRIDEQCRTAMRGIYAIGDVTGEPMLAHRAMAQGEMVAEIIAGHPQSWDKRAVPAVCFSDPEIVTAGLSPADAQRAGIDAKVGLFPFAANGRAMTRGDDDGFVRVVARADNHLILGIQAVARDASEFASAFSLALEMGSRLEDVAGTIHAHPTLGEAIQEASLKALGKAVHL
jgi:dihydrolipoamide dehydrogenase